MQTTAIRTVANSLPENDVILLTLLISRGIFLIQIYEKLVLKQAGPGFDLPKVRIVAPKGGPERTEQQPVSSFTYGFHSQTNMFFKNVEIR